MQAGLRLNLDVVTSAFLIGQPLLDCIAGVLELRCVQRARQIGSGPLCEKPLMQVASLSSGASKFALCAKAVCAVVCYVFRRVQGIGTVTRTGSTHAKQK